MSTELPEGQTPELAFAKYLLKREGITLPEGKEFKASLSGKAPIFPEEDMERRKREYLAFLLGEGAHF